MDKLDQVSQAITAEGEITLEKADSLEARLKEICPALATDPIGMDSSAWKVCNFTMELITTCLTGDNLDKLTSGQKNSLETCLTCYFPLAMGSVLNSEWADFLRNLRKARGNQFQVPTSFSAFSENDRIRNASLRAAQRKSLEFSMFLVRVHAQCPLPAIESSGIILGVVLVSLLKFDSSERGDQQFADEKFQELETLVSLKKRMQFFLILVPLLTHPNVKNWLCDQLALCLSQANGLLSFVQSMLEGENEERPLWRLCEIIGQVLGPFMYHPDYRVSILGQLESLFSVAIAEKNEKYISVCVACCNASLTMQNLKKQKRPIGTIFTRQWQKLAYPKDLLTGMCVLDEQEFRAAVEWNFVGFRGSSVSGLKTGLIAQFLPLLFQLASLLPEDSVERKQLQSVVTHALANRDGEALQEIIRHILIPSKEAPDADSKFPPLHKRVGVRVSPIGGLSLVIVSPEEAQKRNTDFALDFVNLLKTSNNNLLIFDVFMAMLKIFEDVMAEETPSIDTQLVTEEDAEEFVGRVFQRKSVIVAALAELIAYKPFHFQFTENPSQILEFIENLLRRKVENYKKSDEQVLILILSIFREFVSGEAENYEREVQEIRKLAEELRDGKAEGEELKNQIDFFLSKWTEKETGEIPVEKSPYEVARELCSNKEPYLRVYGLKETMKLIRTKDPETMANLHSILLSCLVYLRDEDSYSFLASIQLLVLLTRHLEGEVVETLVAEFQDENNSMDLRLKIGEAIVKTVEGLGVFAVKYKELFLNCFLRGVAEKRSSDEYRVSCLYNLGQICKFLSFQVRGFFHEMVGTLKMVLEQDAYLPARRAAALLLVDLLKGMENLMDFQEFLLPVYRLLKHICDNDADEKTRIHANAGLEVLKEKIKEALTPVERIEKEIRILGIETEKEHELKFPK